jgi:hypothetical protein
MIDVTRYVMQEDLPYFELTHIENTRTCDGEVENTVDFSEENIYIALI